MIFKIQLPIVTSEDEALAIIYNEDRSISFFTPAENVEHLFPEGEFKIYVRGVIVNGKHYQLNNATVIEDQSW